MWTLKWPAAICKQKINTQEVHGKIWTTSVFSIRHDEVNISVFCCKGKIMQFSFIYNICRFVCDLEGIFKFMYLGARSTHTSVGYSQSQNY